jgi:hypothetical protein
MEFAFAAAASKNPTFLRISSARAVRARLQKRIERRSGFIKEDGNMLEKTKPVKWNRFQERRGLLCEKALVMR